MKRLFLIFLFLLPLVNSFSTDLKQQYAPQETMIIALQGNILEPIQAANVEFRRANVLIPVEYEVKQINNQYFIWALAPAHQDNYTLVLKDVATTREGVQETLRYEQNFSVAGNHTVYNLKPGVISARAPFNIEITSFADQDIIISTTFPYEQNLLLKPGKNVFTFPVTSVRGNIVTTLPFGVYRVPAHLTGNASPEITTFVYFEPAHISRTIAHNQLATYRISVRNPTNQTYRDLVFAFDETVFVIEPDTPFALLPGGVHIVNVTLRKLFGTSLEEHLSLTIGDQSITLPIELSSTENGNVSNQSAVFQYYCAELGGSACNGSMTCSGQLKSALDGTCCIGVCKTDVEKNSSNAWIGYALGLIALLIIGFVFIRYKRTKPEGLVVKESESKEKRRIP